MHDSSLLFQSPVLFGNQQPDSSKAEKFEEALVFLDGFLKNQPWVAGQQLTIADFSIVAIIATAEVLILYDIEIF
jgi:glutathione S-transferase